MSTAKKKRAAESVKKYRERMRRQGFRLLQLWVPDTSAPGFAEEFHRQVMLVAKKESTPEAEAEWEALLNEQDFEGWKY